MKKVKEFIAGLGTKKYIYFASVIIIFFGSGITFGRYAYTEIKNFYFNSQKFYFNSDKLSEKGTIIEMTNWSGVGQYAITFNMNSYANNNLSSESDIYYDISFECSKNVNCDLVENGYNRVISQTKNSDAFTIVITVPTSTVLESQDVVELNVKAISTSPYTKTLKGTFRLIVGHYGLSYVIDDQKNSPYLETRITNTLDYYTVKEAFGDYEVDDLIDIDTYQNFTLEEKKKCVSALVTLTFDPNIVLLDMTSDEYIQAKTFETIKIGGYEYTSSITFDIDALSSRQVKFYKVIPSNNYTYPSVSNSSIISVNFS